MTFTRSAAVALLASLCALAPVPGIGATEPEGVCLLPDDERPPLEEPVELCGVTTISGSGPGMIRVRVTAPARLTLAASGVVNFGPGRDNDLAGEGRIVGFAVMEDRPGGRGVAFVRLPAALDLFGRYAWHGFNGAGASPSFFDLSPGDHRLYLLADGQPVTVTLAFEGLEGHVEAAPTRPVSLDVLGPMDPVAPCLPACPYYSAGDTGTLTTGGIGFMSFLHRDVVNAAGAYGLCNYVGDPGPREVAYLPGCPNIPQSDLLMVAPYSGFGSPLYSRVDELWGPLPAGDYGMGAWAVRGSVSESAAMIAFFLSFD